MNMGPERVCCSLQILMNPETLQAIDIGVLAKDFASKPETSQTNTTPSSPPIAITVPWEAAGSDWLMRE